MGHRRHQYIQRSQAESGKKANKYGKYNPERNLVGGRGPQEEYDRQSTQGNQSKQHNQDKLNVYKYNR